MPKGFHVVKWVKDHFNALGMNTIKNVICQLTNELHSTICKTGDLHAYQLVGHFRPPLHGKFKKN